MSVDLTDDKARELVQRWVASLKDKTQRLGPELERDLLGWLRAGAAAHGRDLFTAKLAAEFELTLAAAETLVLAASPLRQVTLEHAQVVAFTFVIQPGSPLLADLEAGRVQHYDGHRWVPVRGGVNERGQQVWQLELAPAGESN